MRPTVRKWSLGYPVPLETSGALQRVSMDHTSSDINVVNDHTTPWMTLLGHQHGSHEREHAADISKQEWFKSAGR